MKTKIIPFDLETAKKIQAGEIKGKITTKLGESVRMVLYAEKEDYPIITLVDNGKKEEARCYSLKGKLFETGNLHAFDLVLEVPDKKPQGETKQNFETVAESDAYAEGYKNGFEAGRTVAFDDNKCMMLKTNKPQFKPFDKVLVRNNNEEVWQPRLYEMYSGGTEKHYCQDRQGYLQCIPYDGNQDLVGTINKPKEE